MLDTATADELKAEIMKHLKILAPVLELDAIPELRGLAPADGSADGAQHSAGNDARLSRHVKKQRPRHGDQSLAGASTGS